MVFRCDVEIAVFYHSNSSSDIKITQKGSQNYLKVSLGSPPASKVGKGQIKETHGGASEAQGGPREGPRRPDINFSSLFAMVS